MYNLIGLN